MSHPIWVCIVEGYLVGCTILEGRLEGAFRVAPVELWAQAGSVEGTARNSQVNNDTLKPLGELLSF